MCFLPVANIKLHYINADLGLLIYHYSFLIGGGQ